MFKQHIIIINKIYCNFIFMSYIGYKIDAHITAYRHLETYAADTGAGNNRHVADTPSASFQCHAR